MTSPEQEPPRAYWTPGRVLANLVGLFVWFWFFTFAAYLGVAGDYAVPPTAAEEARTHRFQAIYLSIVLVLAVAAIVVPAVRQVRAWRRTLITSEEDQTPAG